MSRSEASLFDRISPTDAAATDGSRIHTVSELTRRVRNVLEENVGRVWVVGEISNFRRPASGHCYFSLKDDAAQINVVMWRTLADLLQFEPQDGLEVVLQGELTVYEPRGQYQLVARRIEPRGVGALQLAFLQLKEKLAKEGLFDPARKKPLPFLPQRIALVTSGTGAAVRDMINVITRRFPPANLLVCPVHVQGEGAAGEIARMIARVNELPAVDVMIVGRGGGSIEDLWAFNEEAVARAIAASRIPVISAVGHETDFTIADFVADVRALTPTDAGTHVVPDLRQLEEALSAAGERLARALQRRLATGRERLEGLTRAYVLRRPLERIRIREQRLDDLAQQLFRSVQHRLENSRQRISNAAARLESLSPLNVLGRGYSLTFSDDGMLITDAGTLKPGDTVHTRLRQGSFSATVTDTVSEAAPKKQSKSPGGRKKRATTTRKKTAKKKTSSGKGRSRHGQRKDQV